MLVVLLIRLVCFAQLLCVFEEINQASWQNFAIKAITIDFSIGL